MNRRRRVRVPASSANLGPGYDALAAALSPSLELEVEETGGGFAVDCDLPGVPLDRSNLCVRAFELLSPADGLAFRIRSQIPPGAGLGSSAAAIVAGLVAADHLYELGLGRDEIYAHAVALEGHPDNVAAALYGGFALCPRPDGDVLPVPVRLEPPQGVEGILVIPGDEVATADARAALPATVTLDAAIENVAAAGQLVIRQSIAYAESAERAVPILDYRPDRGQDYLSLAGEILRRVGRSDLLEPLDEISTDLVPAGARA